MPSATLDDIVFRSTNPVKRAMDVFCLIILQVLTLMVLAAEQNPEKLRNHPALGPHSILARLDTGETFDLPLILIAVLRMIASSVRADLPLANAGVAQREAPIPSPENPAAPAKAKRSRTQSRRRAAPSISRAPRRARRSPDHATAQPRGDPSAFKRKAPALPSLPMSIPLRCRNEYADRPANSIAATALLTA